MILTVFTRAYQAPCPDTDQSSLHCDTQMQSAYYPFQYGHSMKVNLEVIFCLQIFVLNLCIQYSPSSSSSDIFARSILPDIIISIALFVQSNKL